MKKVILFAVCASAFAAFAQDEAQRPRGERPTGNAGRMGDARNESPAKAEESTDSSSSGQEDFDQIMGSFSELAMKFSEEDAASWMYLYMSAGISAEVPSFRRLSLSFP